MIGARALEEFVQLFCDFTRKALGQRGRGFRNLSRHSAFKLGNLPAKQMNAGQYFANYVRG
jgi:hypothetical protein